MAEKLSLEKATEELSSMISKLEDNTLNLEESIDAYQKAGELLAYCYKMLNNYQGRITDINRLIESAQNGEE